MSIKIPICIDWSLIAQGKCGSPFACWDFIFSAILAVVKLKSIYFSLIQNRTYNLLLLQLCTDLCKLLSTIMKQFECRIKGMLCYMLWIETFISSINTFYTRVIMCICAKVNTFLYTSLKFQFKHIQFNKYQIMN